MGMRQRTTPLRYHPRGVSGCSAPVCRCPSPVNPPCAPWQRCGRCRGRSPACEGSEFGDGFGRAIGGVVKDRIIPQRLVEGGVLREGDLRRGAGRFPSCRLTLSGQPGRPVRGVRRLRFFSVRCWLARLTFCWVDSRIARIRSLSSLPRLSSVPTPSRVASAMPLMSRQSGRRPRPQARHSWPCRWPADCRPRWRCRRAKGCAARQAAHGTDQRRSRCQGADKTRILRDEPRAAGHWVIDVLGDPGDDEARQGGIDPGDQTRRSPCRPSPERAKPASAGRADYKYRPVAYWLSRSSLHCGLF